MATRGLTLRLLAASFLTVLITLVWAGNAFNVEDATPVSFAQTEFPDLYEASIAGLQDGMERGLFTSVDLVKVSLGGLVKSIICRQSMPDVRHRPILRVSKR